VILSEKQKSFWWLTRLDSLLYKCDVYATVIVHIAGFRVLKPCSLVGGCRRF
jgi:hypothetical protein